MPLLPSCSAGEGRHLLYLAITLLLLTLLQPSEAEQCRSGSASYHLGATFECTCPYTYTEEPNVTDSQIDSTTTCDPVPQFRWLLKSQTYTYGNVDFKPIDTVLGTNRVQYSSNSCTMSTTLLTQDHEGTYKCECYKNCSNIEVPDNTFTVSIKEGLAVYDDTFNTLAWTEHHTMSFYGSRRYYYPTAEVSVEVGTKVYCTSSYDSFNRNGRHCVGFDYYYWLDYYYWYPKCSTSTSTAEVVLAVHVDCSVQDTNRRQFVSIITIRIAERELPDVKHCKANATEVELTFNAVAYQEKYSDLRNTQVVIALSTDSSNYRSQDIDEIYKSALDQFVKGITLSYYILDDGDQSSSKTIKLESTCGRPRALEVRACTANATILYLELGEYEESNKTVLEIEHDNGSLSNMVHPSDKTEFWIPGNVKKVVYYAVFDDGQESLKAVQLKTACIPTTQPPTVPITAPPTTPPTTTRGPFTTYPTTIIPDQVVLTVSISAAVSVLALAVIGGITITYCILSRIADRKEKKAASAIAPARVRHIVRYRHNVLLHAPFTNDALVSERVVKVRDFREYVKQGRKENSARFRQEFGSLTVDYYSELTTMFGKMAMYKNRYSNIRPYDHNRVIICGDTDEDAYVNASYINGYNLPRAYIAAQGPIATTVCDFWEMVWNSRSRRLVMLTKVDEDGTRKCEKYWPDSNEDKRCRPGRELNVELQRVDRYNDYEIRDFTVTKDSRPYDEPLPVRMFHFLAWPDHGVPLHPTSILRFMQEVKKHEQEYITPTIVHCSAGVGRTGTYIALDYCIDRLADTSLDSKIIEIHGLVQMLRLQRAHMVQTEEQYIFIHDALLEYTYTGSKSMTPGKLVAVVKAAKPKDKKSNLTGFEDEFEFMKEVSRKFTMADQFVWLQYGSENRYSNRCPYKGGYLDVLDQRGMVEKDYINATMVDGCKQEKTYVAAQTPMAHSVDRFWSTILWDFDIHSVVVLADFEEKGKDTCYKFWPDKELEPDVYGFVGVVLKTVTKYGCFTAYTCEVRNEAMRKMKTREVVIFHYPKWPEDGRPTASSHIVEMIHQLDRVQERAGNSKGRILVSCNDGMGRTGSFLCMHREVQRLKEEGLVSVFQSARALRSQRPNLIKNAEQYAAVYEVIAEYHQSIDRYTNKN